MPLYVKESKKVYRGKKFYKHPRVLIELRERLNFALSILGKLEFVQIDNEVFQIKLAQFDQMVSISLYPQCATTYIPPNNRW